MQQKRLRALGITTLKRAPSFPDVPTISEAALSGYDMPNWVGLLGPAQTPPEIVNRLRAEMSRWHAAPETQQKLQSMGVEFIPCQMTMDMFGLKREDLIDGMGDPVGAATVIGKLNEGAAPLFI